MEFTVSTRGFNDIVDITSEISRVCEGGGVTNGVASVFVVGSTAALSTIEYEPGAIADLKAALDRIAPMDATYQHNEAWHDGNGYAHLRAALMKPSLSIPIVGGRLVLGRGNKSSCSTSTTGPASGASKCSSPNPSGSAGWAS